MSDSRLHTHPPLRAVAFCDYALTDGQFEEYVATADYMSKRKRLNYLLVLLVIYILAFVLPFWFIAGPVPSMIFITCVMLFLLAVLIRAIATEKPAWWGIPYQNKQLLHMYSDALGLRPDDPTKEYRFSAYGNCIQFATLDRTLVASLEDVRWVRRKGDLVIVGCRSGAGSAVSPFRFKGTPHYKAVPAMVFHASKLEGMDPDELVALLEECAKKPKRPAIRKDAWN